MQFTEKEKCGIQRRTTIEPDITHVESLDVEKNESVVACDSSDVSPMSANQEATVAHVRFPSAPSLFVRGKENYDFFPSAFVIFFG